jgi:hypothetical protein
MFYIAQRLILNYKSTHRVCGNYNEGTMAIKYLRRLDMPHAPFEEIWSRFRKAYEMVPIKGHGGINEIVRGPAYVWAVLHDARISSGEW